MTDRDITLLKMALNIGWDAFNKVYDTMEYCENMRDDFYMMIVRLGETINVDLRDVT